LPAVEKLIAEQTARFEAAVAEINKLQSKSVAQINEFVEGATRVAQEQIAFREQLGGEWRKAGPLGHAQRGRPLRPRRRRDRKQVRPPTGRPGSTLAASLIDPLRRERSTEVAMARLEGRTALVTGASRGLGRAIRAEAGGGRGPRGPQTTGCEEGQAREVADLIHSLGGTALLVRADVSVKDEARSPDRQCPRAVGAPRRAGEQRGDHPRPLDAGS